MDSSIYQHRRQQVIASLGVNDIAIIPNALEKMRNADCDFPYRHDSYFYYLTGFTEPQSWLVLTGQGQSIVFCRPKDEVREIWDGLRLGVDDAANFLGVDLAYSVEQIEQIMPKLLQNKASVWYPFSAEQKITNKILGWINEVKKLVRAGITAPNQLINLANTLDELRLIKDQHELSQLAKACSISAQAHILAMQKSAFMLRKGQTPREYHLEATLLEHFRSNGAQSVAYNSIVGTGANSCILHYRAADAQIQANDIVLIDAGCEYNSYASDITRSFNASGKFTTEQAEIYQIVLAAQQAVIDLVKPGLVYSKMHACAVEIISQGLLDIGLLDKNKVGGLQDVIANQSYNKFFMHGTGHWMGMDVHDVGSYAQPNVIADSKDQRNRLLQPNMVFTVEPGIYIRPSADVAEKYWNIGIRIEDDVVVTQHGYQLLTREVPVEMAEIEAIMRS